MSTNSDRCAITFYFHSFLELTALPFLHQSSSHNWSARKEKVNGDHALQWHLIRKICRGVFNERPDLDDIKAVVWPMTSTIRNML